MNIINNSARCNPVIRGIGITSAIGQGKDSFCSALLDGRHAFDVMKRPGRQNETAFIGAEIPELLYPDDFPKRVVPIASFSGQVALVTLYEAWKDAKLDGVEPERIGLIIGGKTFS